MRKIFITGIGTDVGKTIVAAILTEALQADYWKPVQAGITPFTDSQLVRTLVKNPKSVIHPETYVLQHPMSPHAAAQLEGITIIPKTIIIPKSSNETMIIEGAGGLMVPLTEQFLMADLITQLDAEVIVVSRNYLGSINHSLLTLEELKRRKCKIAGIVFNGEPTPPSENIILSYSGIKKLPHFPILPSITPENISILASSIKKHI